MRSALIATLFLLSIAASPASQITPTRSSLAPAGPRTYGPRLEGFDYPFPVREYRTVAQGQSVEMAY